MEIKEKEESFVTSSISEFNSGGGVVSYSKQKRATLSKMIAESMCHSK